MLVAPYATAASAAVGRIEHDRVEESDVRGWLFGALLEDTETAPVPAGCPHCYLRGGRRCERCPAGRRVAA